MLAPTARMLGAESWNSRSEDSEDDGRFLKSFDSRSGFIDLGMRPFNYWWGISILVVDVATREPA